MLWSQIQNYTWKTGLYIPHTHKPLHFRHKRTETSPAGLGDIRTKGSSAVISLCTEDKHVLSAFTVHNGKPHHTVLLLDLF